MAFEDPNIAGAYGALDSAAFADGGSYNAHLLREMVRSANHLASKGEHLLCLPWAIRVDSPTYDLGDANDAWKLHEGLSFVCPTTTWTRVLPGLTVTKKPGLSSADVHIDARITASDTVWLQITTTEAPFDPHANAASPNVLVVTGDGDNDVDQYTLTGLPINAKGWENFEIFAKARPTGNLADTSVGGVYNASTGLTNRAYIAQNLIQSEDSTWQAPGWPSAGTEIVFYNRQDEVVTRRSIYGVSTNTGATVVTLIFQAMTPQNLAEVQIAQEAFWGSHNPTPTEVWEVHKLPRLGMACFSVAANARTE